jgi:hypothetical protein
MMASISFLIEKERLGLLKHVTDMLGSFLQTIMPTR